MSKVIKCVELADGTPGPAGCYLAEYDEQTGESKWTPHLDGAKKFDDAFDAMLLWKSVLPSQPTRPWDGKPNRPLTAFTITIENADA